MLLQSQQHKKNPTLKPLIKSPTTILPHLRKKNFKVKNFYIDPDITNKRENEKREKKLSLAVCETGQSYT